MRQTIAVLTAGLAFTVLVAANRRRRAARNGSHVSEDCAASECAADGLPLSSYAG